MGRDGEVSESVGHMGIGLVPGRCPKNEAEKKCMLASESTMQEKRCCSRAQCFNNAAFNNAGAHSHWHGIRTTLAGAAPTPRATAACSVGPQLPWPGQQLPLHCCSRWPLCPCQHRTRQDHSGAAVSFGDSCFRRQWLSHHLHLRRAGAAPVLP